MRIDIGGRIGNLGDLRYSADQLAADAAACEVEKILVANVAAASESVGGDNQDEADANWETLRVCEQHPRFMPVYWARPGQPDHNLYAVAGALAHEPFVGLVLSPEFNDLALDSPDLFLLLQVCARVRVPVLVPVGASLRAGVAAVLTAARQHPKVTWVLQRAAQPALLQQTIDLLRRSSGQQDGSVYADTAACPPERVVPLIRTVGSERILFASDAGNCSGASSSEALAQIESIQRELPPDAARKVLGQNAIRVFPRISKAFKQHMQNV